MRRQMSRGAYLMADVRLDAVGSHLDIFPRNEPTPHLSGALLGRL